MSGETVSSDRLRAGRHTPRVATEQRGVRSWLATVVGYLIVVVVALILIRFVLGSLFWLLRAFLVVVLLLALLTLYARLKADD